MNRIVPVHKMRKQSFSLPDSSWTPAREDYKCRTSAGNKNTTLPQRARCSNSVTHSPAPLHSPTAAIYNTTSTLGAMESPNTAGTSVFPPVRTENLFVPRQWLRRGWGCSIACLQGGGGTQTLSAPSYGFVKPRVSYIDLQSSFRLK